MYSVQLLAEQGFFDIGEADRLPSIFEQGYYNCAVNNGQNFPLKRAKLHPDCNSKLRVTLPVIEETSFNPNHTQALKSVRLGDFVLRAVANTVVGTHNTHKAYLKQFN